MSANIEYRLFEREAGVCIFKIPPLSTSKGYYLDDWKEMIWEGGIKIVDLNNQQVVIFLSKDKEFARFTVPKDYREAVQKTNDSARGYGVRLQNPKGGNMWIGVAFRDRNDAFDFNMYCSEFQEKKDRELHPEKYMNEIKVQDFKLNEKIVIGDNGVKTVSGSNQNKPKSDLKNFKFGDFSQSDSQNSSQPKQQQNSFANNNNNNLNQQSDFSDFANFGSSNNNNQQKQQSQQKGNGGGFSDFGDFSNFGQSNNNNKPQQQQQQFQQQQWQGNQNNNNQQQQQQQQQIDCDDLLGLGVDNNSQNQNFSNQQQQNNNNHNNNNNDTDLLDLI